MAGAISKARAGMTAGCGSSTAWSGRCSAPSGAREQHATFDDDTPCGTGILPDGRLVVLTMNRKRLLTYAEGRRNVDGNHRHGGDSPHGIQIHHERERRA
jgi:hypothetical protein